MRNGEHIHCCGQHWYSVAAPWASEMLGVYLFDPLVVQAAESAMVAREHKGQARLDLSEVTRRVVHAIVLGQTLVDLGHVLIRRHI